MGGNVAAAAGCAAGYLIGSVPFGLIVGRIAGGVDVRDVGSGNIGTTNVLRAAGAKAGALTFALDVAKGAAAVGVARRMGLTRQRRRPRASPRASGTRGPRSPASGAARRLPRRSVGSSSSRPRQPPLPRWQASARSRLPAPCRWGPSRRLRPPRLGARSRAAGASHRRAVRLLRARRDAGGCPARAEHPPPPARRGAAAVEPSVRWVVTGRRCRYNGGGGARRGCSGALYPQSAVAGLNSPPRGRVVGSAPGRACVSTTGSRAARAPVNPVRSGRKQR